MSCLLVVRYHLPPSRDTAGNCTDGHVICLHLAQKKSFLVDGIKTRKTGQVQFGAMAYGSVTSIVSWGLLTSIGPIQV